MFTLYVAAFRRVSRQHRSHQLWLHVACESLPEVQGVEDLLEGVRQGVEEGRSRTSFHHG